MNETAQPQGVDGQVEQVEAPLPSNGRLFTAEFLGTFLLIVFGLGSVHTAVLLEAQAGIWQVAMVWGVSIMLAVFVAGSVSGAHINPAITLSFATWGRFPWSKVPLYLIAQLLGAFAAAAVLFFAFGSYLDAKEAQQQVTRGEPGSVITAMCYGEYFPNPGSLAAGAGPLASADFQAHWQHVPHEVAFGMEVLGTAILALVVFAVTDARNLGAPGANLAPVFIGLTVAALISFIAPLTQACFNPARDFGPRLFAFLAGWRTAAIPGPNGIGFFTVYILAPIAGGLIGAGVYERLIRSGEPSE